MRIGLTCLCSLLLVACQPPKATTAKHHLHIDSLLQAQIPLLQGFRATKNTQWGDSVYQSITAQIDWEKELAVFRAINLINRPLYFDQYQLTVLPDSGSNLQVKRWRATGDALLREINLYFLPEGRRVKRIEATFAELGFYFQEERKLVLDFTLLGTSNRLESLKIMGQQTYLWGAPQDFRVVIAITP